MKKVLLALIAIMLMATTSHALTVVDFEGLPDDFYYMGGSQNLGDYYEGITFGQEATILDRNIYGYNDSGYPPHSGDAVLFSVSTPLIRVDFDDATNHVEMWYTINYTEIQLQAFNADGDLIAEATGDDNYTSNDFIEVNTAGFDISYVEIHDSGNYFTIDDFGWEETTGGGGGDPIPEPTTILLLASGLLGMGGISRFRRK
ncbi:MAG: PEP-CTERM sorting domain-containing protein [candidate division Zixibacteria bacterium]|nr:PEP-CTERM sorting domain-containing protein [candidate division Zixibacteria bacterium]